jgi:deoxyadenosine/deoxycytidine kinase
MAIYKHIAVEGPIGVGKTSLAERIAKEFGGKLVLEQFEENPFLADFYIDPARHAFATQIFFLLSRFKQLSDLNSADLFHDVVISDYVFDKDKIFAYITLSEAELRLYEEVERNLETDVPRPDLVIYLQATPEVLIRRIKNRGRAYEKRIDEDYLDKLCQAYNYYFFNYDASPLLVVNTESLDLTRRDAFLTLYERICRPIFGTEYFSANPSLWG